MAELRIAASPAHRTAAGTSQHNDRLRARLDSGELQTAQQIIVREFQKET